MGLPALAERPGIWLPPRRRHLRLVTEEFEPQTFQPVEDVATIAFVNNVGTGVTTTSSTTTTITPTQNTAGGDFVIVAGNGAATVLSSVSDSKSNVWSTPITQGTAGSATGFAWAWMDNPILTTDTITVTFGSTGANHIAAAMEFSGVLRTGGVTRDVTAGATGTTATAVSSGASAATTYADQVVFGVIGWAGAATITLTKGASYTALLEKDEGSGAFLGLGIEYKIVSATGTQTADGTLGSAPTSWNAIVASFRARGVIPTNRRQVASQIRASQR